MHNNGTMNGISYGTLLGSNSCIFLARRKQISFSSIDKGGKNRASLFLTTHSKMLQLGRFAELGNKQVMITKRNIR
jgi:hypothetical protein